MDHVTLSVVDGRLRAAVLALRPLPEQERFSGRAENTLPDAEADPARTPFAILASEVPVGFGVLDRGGYLAEVDAAPQSAVLLRAFFVDAAAQGRGLGSAATAALPGLVRAVHPGVERLVLTVNAKNPAAIRAYLRGGFADTGRRYLGGAAGPQHVLVMPLQPS
jgi:RimJ/RimL family protein N-acetyltransferase